MSRSLEKVLKIIFYIIILSFEIGFVVLMCIGFEENNKPDNNSISKCTNIKKFYKDDLLFDNFYIACDEPINLEIEPELYTRIEEGKNYIITFNKVGGLYSIVKENENE